MDDVVDWVAQNLRNALPLTMEEMGHDAFSRRMYEYLHDADGGPQSHDAVEDFIIHLARVDEAPHAVVVGLFEIARRECVDAGPRSLSESELQQAPIERLLAMRVARHPSARAIELAGGAPRSLLARYPKLAEAEGILLIGRGSGALVLPLTAAELLLFRRLAHAQDLFQMLVDAKTAGGSSSAFHRLVKLGVVVEARR